MGRFAFVAVLAVLALSWPQAPFSAVPPDADAAFPGENGKIAFRECCANQVSQIYTVNGDGSDVWQITSGHKDYEPVWSPDGLQIAFSSNREPPLGVYVMDADGTDVQRLADGTAPAWSPDGERIAFVRDDDIWIMNADGSNQLNLTDDESIDEWPDWSPDGTAIAYKSEDGEIRDPIAGGIVEGVYTITTEGVRTKLVEAELFVFGISWSPDGTKIVYEDSATGVNVVGRNGGTPQLLVPEGREPAWSPDGEWIVFVRPFFDFDDPGLSAVPAGGSGAPVEVTHGSHLSPDWGVSTRVLHGVEFTQGIQEMQTVSGLTADLAADGQPPVPLVADKPAAMRVYFDEVDETTLYDVQTLGDVSGSRIVQLDPGCTAEQRRNGENNCRSVDFFFTPPPGDWSATVQVRNHVDGALVEEHEFNLTSVETVPLVVEPVTVCDHIVSQSTGLWGCGSLFDFVQDLDFLRATFPGAVLVAGSGSTIYADTVEIPAGGDWWDVVAGNLRALWAADGGLDNLHHYGVVRPQADAGTPGGIAYTRANAAAGKTGLMRDGLGGGLPEETAGELAAHLLGLNMGLVHAPSASGCYGTPAETDPAWPGAASPETGETGFDVAAEEPVPDTSADWMSLCTPRWISPYTANNVIDRFQPGTPAVSSAPVAPGDFWLVSGLLDEEAGTTEFDPLFELETEGPSGAGAGLYAIEVRDASDGVLFTRYFETDWTVREDEGSLPAQDPDVVRFAELIPVQANAARLVVFAGDDQAGELALGGTTPTVTLTSGIMLAGAPAAPVFSWDVEDGDSDHHSYWVELSNDGGQSWRTIAPRYTATTLAVDNALHGGGEGLLLRVRASDGVNTGAAVSAPFNMQTQPPQGAIVSPASGAAIHEGGLAWLQAIVADPEDGFLDGSSIHWSSSRDGALGTGASLHVYDLSQGAHTVTMTAKDSGNNEVADSITMTVSGGQIVEGEPDVLSGDVDCSGAANAIDALKLSRHVAALSVAQTEPCPDVGTGSPVFGDVNCDGSITAVDALFVLRFVAALPVNLPPGCRAIGT